MIYDPIDLRLQMDLVFLDEILLVPPCPLIDRILQKQVCPLLPQMYLSVFCSVFHV